MANAQGDEAAVSHPLRLVYLYHGVCHPTYSISGCPRPMIIFMMSSRGELLAPTDYRFYNDPTFSDVQIEFSGHSIYAHKFALGKESRYFYKAFTGNFIEAKSDQIDLHDEDDPECVITMLKHIYGVESFQKRPSWKTLSIESAKDNFNSLPKLFVTADKYDVPGLRDKIVSEFIESFDALPQDYYGDDDFCSVFKNVFEHVGSNAMQEALLEACCPKTLEMMAHQAFEQMLSNSGGLASKILANMTTYLLNNCSKVWYCIRCICYIKKGRDCSNCKAFQPVGADIETWEGRLWLLY